MTIKKLMLITLFIPVLGFTQKNDTIKIQKTLNEVNINAIRADKKTPIAFTDIGKADINKTNLGQDMPYIISLTPSIVQTSDAGTGIGYTGFRLRGSDATRINVTINGIPINDAESQGVWWVNMPDLASSIENIQIQRGVGTSTNGGSSFGGTLNLETNKLNKEAYAVTNNSIGSFNTMKNNIEFGTGIIHDKFGIEGRISRIKSDGFIDRAKANLESYFFSGTYYGRNSTLKALMFGGKERTYQAWNGVPIQYLEDDKLRTFNIYSYENEVDNYMQTHSQLHYTKEVNKKTNFNIAWHYTHGEGYYEQEKLDQKLTDYGLENIQLGDTIISRTNLIRRKWLNNNFTGITYSVNHKTEKTKLIVGGSSNRYEGQHYGNVIWAQYAANGEYNHQYYWNKALKDDHNIFAKLNYQYLNKTTFFVDMQGRSIEYTFQGYDENKSPSNQKAELFFFNPKFGIQHIINKNQTIYSSFGIANKEPNRDDYVESEFGSYPKHETLYDYEGGYTINTKSISLSANAYYMFYKNQLVPTGEINNVGAYIRTNIEASFRTGLEIEGAIQLSKKIKLGANITVSKNKISRFTEYIDNWDSWDQDSIEHENTDIAFSPNIIWASQISYLPYDNLELDFISKYVGEQYIDNTSSKERMLDDYLINHIRIIYNWENSLFTTTKITLKINNVLNNKYESNAWTYRFISENYDPRQDDIYVTKGEKGYNMSGYFPQAGRHYLLGIMLGL
ncbi:MAG: TonB-dependent receptor plug domain-containing protein [Bacteroidota bacterium]|nr:TonB-dependent receptor plug domain-containing protein [Bacteroidota bacterium]